MENDEITVQPSDETNAGQPVVVEEDPTEGGSQEPEPKPEGITLTGAELRHYNKWKDSQKGQQPVQPQPVSPQPSNVEETVLLAQGMPEALLGELKAVAKARGLSSLIKAQTDPIFVAVKVQFEKDQKQKEASLPASRGAGGVKAKVSPNTPNLARDEHMRLAKEALK